MDCYNCKEQINKKSKTRMCYNCRCNKGITITTTDIIKIYKLGKQDLVNLFSFKVFGGGRKYLIKEVEELVKEKIKVCDKTKNAMIKRQILEEEKINKEKNMEERKIIINALLDEYLLKLNEFDMDYINKIIKSDQRIRTFIETYITTNTSLMDTITSIIFIIEKNIKIRYRAIELDKHISRAINGKYHYYARLSDEYKNYCCDENIPLGVTLDSIIIKTLSKKGIVSMKK